MVSLHGTGDGEPEPGTGCTWHRGQHARSGMVRLLTACKVRDGTSADNDMDRAPGMANLAPMTVLCSAHVYTRGYGINLPQFLYSFETGIHHEG